MKLVLFLSLLFITSSLNALDLTVRVIEGWKSKSVENAKITLKSINGEILYEGMTNGSGRVTISDLTKGKYQLFADDYGDEFKGSWRTFKFSKKENNEITLMLAPTDNYRQTQRTLEDEKYGPPVSKKIEKTESGDTSEPVKTDSVPESKKTETIEVWAEYPGGAEAMQEFIEKTLIYPEISKELGDQGKIYVVFIVQPDGMITHVNTLVGVSEELDDEAMRLVRSMPPWTPGSVNGEKVRSRCSLPITFTLR